MLAVLSPSQICGISLSGYIEEIFVVADKIREQCRLFISSEKLTEIDDDQQTITLLFTPGHPLTEERVDKILEEQDAGALYIIYLREEKS
jgi:hypothetical protein